MHNNLTETRSSQISSYFTHSMLTNIKTYFFTVVSFIEVVYKTIGLMVNDVAKGKCSDVEKAGLVHGC